MPKIAPLETFQEDRTELADFNSNTTPSDNTDEKSVGSPPPAIDNEDGQQKERSTLHNDGIPNATHQERSNTEVRFVDTTVESTGVEPDENQPKNGNASMTDGESADAATATVDGNVVIGDQFHGSQVQLFTEPTETNEGWRSEPPRKVKDKYVKRFAKKLNAYTLRNIDVTKTMSGANREITPQMKTGVRISKGEVVPQEGFTTRFQRRTGKPISFEKYLDLIQNHRELPTFLIGPAGSGKTTVLNRVATQLILENELNQTSGQKVQEKLLKCFGGLQREFDIIYLFNVEDIPDLTEATLAQVIFNPTVTNLTVDEAQHGLQAILQDQIKIVILMDGLDRATWEPTRDDMIGHWDKASTATIFGNILSGQLLSTIPITISSTEHSIACLSESMRPNSITALVGISKQDAEKFYCETMGEGAAKYWSDLKITSPRLMYMCLNPMFLTFYMTAKRASTNVTIECASEVLIRIIELLLQAGNTDRNNVADVINKLKPMAFQGSQERRVTFGNEDLTKFGLQSTMMNDLIIKVAGQNSPGLKILEGRHRCIFVHQSLQEILSAIHAAEKSFEDFKAFVDEELHKDHWSVVRMFLCGILKNERVKNGIPGEIFNAENLEEKREYLMLKVAERFQFNPSPIEKLDLLISLDEADALDSLKEHTTTIDFANTPMTAMYINVLISALKRLDKVELLSLAGCGIDDTLLDVLATWTSRDIAQIGTLDLSGNSQWTDQRLWRKLFSHYTIQVCRLDIPSGNRHFSGKMSMDATFNRMWEVAKAARDSGVALRCQVAALNMTFDEIKELSNFDVRLQIGELCLTRAVVKRTNYILLREFFAVHKVQRCLINIQPEKGDVDASFFVEVCKLLVASETSQFRFEKLRIHQSMAQQLDELSKLDRKIEIGLLAIQPNNGEFDVDLWRRVFQHLSVDTCRISSTREDCVKLWLMFINAAIGGNMKRIILEPEANFGLTSAQIADLNEKMPEGMLVAIEELQIRVKDGRHFSAEEWKSFGKAFKKFRIKLMHCDSYPEFPDLPSIAAGYQDLQCKQLRLAWKGDDEGDMQYFSLTSRDDNQVDAMYVNYGQERLENQAEAIGDAIRSLQIKEVVFGRMNCMFPRQSFAQGLNGAEINIIASIDLGVNDLRAIYTKCDVRKLQILENDEGKIKAFKASRAKARREKNQSNRATTGGRSMKKGPKNADKDEFLSESEWLRKFTVTAQS